MALLSDESMTERALKRESFRMSNVSSRLTCTEVERLDELAKKHGQQRGEFIRRLILDELARQSGEPTVSAELTEIIGAIHLIHPRTNLRICRNEKGNENADHHDRTQNLDECETHGGPPESGEAHLAKRKNRASIEPP